MQASDPSLLVNLAFYFMFFLSPTGPSSVNSRAPGRKEAAVLSCGRSSLVFSIAPLLPPLEKIYSLLG